MDKPKTPSTFAEFVEQSGIEELAGVGAKGIPMADKTVMICLTNADAVQHADFERRREIVQAITQWATKKFNGRWISGVILYSPTLDLMVKDLGAELVHSLQAKRWPARWSKDVRPQ